MRVGFIGAGWAATEHARSLQVIGGADVAGIVDLDARRASEFAAWTGAPVFASPEDLIQAGALDAVVIATPPGSRRDSAVAALEAGVAVFLEKPIARTFADAIAIVRARERSGAVCAVGYQWRAAAAVAALRRAVDGAAVALMISVGVGITQARTWFGDHAQSGGLVSERGSHHIDLQRAVGGEVRRVRGVRGAVPLAGASSVATDELEDVISLSLEFTSGAIGAVHVAWTPEGFPSTHSLSVVADDGAYALELDPVFALHGTRSGASVVAESAEPPFVAGLARFLEAVRTGDPGAVACTAEDAAGSLATALACERALASGDAVAVESLPGSGYRSSATGVNPTGGS